MRRPSQGLRSIIGALAGVGVVATAAGFGLVADKPATAIAERFGAPAAADFVATADIAFDRTGSLGSKRSTWEGPAGSPFGALPRASSRGQDAAERELAAALQRPIFLGPLSSGEPSAAPDEALVAALTNASVAIAATRSMSLGQQETRDDAGLAYASLPDANHVGSGGVHMRRLTILQLGDSHTAADFFSGRVRERLQAAFGSGGDAYLVPGNPHIGVRSALFESLASDGWTYEALQKSDDHRRFYLTGFNAVARHAGASLDLKSRDGQAYDRLEVAFLKQPGGGRADILIDGEPGGEVNLDGAAGERAVIDVNPTPRRSFHDVTVRADSDAAVTVTGLKVGREGPGVSYMSLGFPGATVQLLQKLSTENLADDFRRLAPDYVVLAFGTNEGFDDNLDVRAYVAQYEAIVRRLQALRPGLRVVMIGPPDAARPAGGCHAAGVGEDCGVTKVALTAEVDGACRFPTPPKLAEVRSAQRALAQRLGAEFWDWSSVMPPHCGALAWAAETPPLMGHDYVHMTLEGYRRSGDKFADFLIPLISGQRTDTHVVSND